MTITLGQKKLFAKGRLRTGEMNRTEEKYRQHLEAEKQAGKVAEYWFESLKVRIADGACWYLPDFVVLRPDGALELHEVKGSPAIFQEDAKVKVKCTATRFPFRVFVAFPDKKLDWRMQEY